MALLSAAEIRAHVETDLDDAAVQRLIDRLDAEIVQRAGPHTGSLTEVLSGAAFSVFVAPPIASVTSLREGDRIQPATPALTLDEDFRVWPAEARIERLPAGAAFADLVEVVYTPLDDTDRRRRVLLELVRLDLAQSGRAAEAVGSDYRYRGLNYTQHREALLREVRPFLTLE